MSKQTVLHVGLLAWLAILWIGLVTWRDQPMIMVLTALLASPLLLLFLRMFLEDGRPKGLFNPSTQSWAFLFGDIVWLPLAFGAAAYGQRFVPSDSWFRTPWWLVACVIVGGIAGGAFHKLDQGAYIGAGYGQALMSPTKLAHDFVSYPLLFGGLLFLALPVVVHHFLWSGAAALAGVLLWGAMGARDMGNAPRPQDMHPKWDTVNFRTK